MEIDLFDTNPGTRLRFRQSALPEGFEAVGRGWGHYLDRLGQVTIGIDPGPDPNQIAIA